MDRKLYFCFERADFHVAAREMFALYFPGLEPENMSSAQLSAWLKQPGEQEVVFTGTVTGEDSIRHCLVNMYYVRDGERKTRQATRDIRLLPWEAPSGGERRGIRILISVLLTEYFHVAASPWGTLRGIRPTKLVHYLIDDGQDGPAIRALLHKEYAVEMDKAALLTDIALRQRPVLLSEEQARRLVSVYIGIPFCPSRCLYCSFPAFPITGAGQRVTKFLTALRQEIEDVGDFLGKRGLAVQTIYIGGGTPTSLSDALFGQLLAAVSGTFSGGALQEFTVEAGRPDTITREKLALMREYAVSRISINPQTMREYTLRHIGRSHRAADVEGCYDMARQYGFSAINMDIIAGLPGEKPEDMAYTLEKIALLRPENLTVHTLAVKRGSELKETAGFCLSAAPIVREMLALCEQKARNWGMEPYYLYRQKYMAGNLENVGYTLPGRECLYNIHIMEERQTILGLGVAAGTKAVYPGSWRLNSCYNPKDVPTYLNEFSVNLARKLALVDRVLRNEEEALC